MDGAAEEIGHVATVEAQSGVAARRRAKMAAAEIGEEQSGAACACLSLGFVVPASDAAAVAGKASRFMGMEATAKPASHVNRVSKKAPESDATMANSKWHHTGATTEAPDGCLALCLSEFGSV